MDQAVSKGDRDLFDEPAYLEKYLDIARASAEGIATSSRNHYAHLPAVICPNVAEHAQ